jgi:hypothetical protein
MNAFSGTVAAPPSQGARAFQFERDTLTFANELVWQYRFDPQTGAMSVAWNDPPPTYSHRCFVVVRSVRQFFYHARFEAKLPETDPESYQRLIRRVVSRSAWRTSAAAERVTIPGFDCLRAFSRAHEPLLKAECGGPWQSYFLRSHWRMVFPVWRRHQESVAEKLRRAVQQGLAPTVHLFRFPRITINHGILLFALEEKQAELEFTAYDPNIPSQPVKLFFDCRRKAFRFPPTCYWPGGTLSVVEIFRSRFF